jgi:ferredoxin
MIDGKARLFSDLVCDGLGACIGDCPEGAISIEEREALDYDERMVMETIVKQGQNVIRAHLEHLKAHNQREYLKTALDFLKERDIELPPLEVRASDGGQEQQIVELSTLFITRAQTNNKEDSDEADKDTS